MCTDLRYTGSMQKGAFHHTRRQTQRQCQHDRMQPECETESAGQLGRARAPMRLILTLYSRLKSTQKLSAPKILSRPRTLP